MTEISMTPEMPTDDLYDFLDGYEGDFEDDFDDGYEDDLEDDTVEEDENDHDVASHAVDTKYLTVEFNYHEGTPLQYVLDEISNYIEDNKLDFVTVHAMHTSHDESGDTILIATFDVQGI